MPWLLEGPLVATGEQRLGLCEVGGESRQEGAAGPMAGALRGIPVHKEMGLFAALDYGGLRLQFSQRTLGEIERLIMDAGIVTWGRTVLILGRACEWVLRIGLCHGCSEGISA